MLLGFFLFKISDEQSDEQFSDNVDKQMLNQQVHENVTQLNKCIKKAALSGFFFTSF